MGAGKWVGHPEGCFNLEAVQVVTSLVGVRDTEAELKAKNSLQRAGEHVETLSGQSIGVEVYISTRCRHTQAMPAKIGFGNHQPPQSKWVLLSTMRSGHGSDHGIQCVWRRVVDHQRFAAIKMAYRVHHIFAGRQTHIGSICRRVISGLAKYNGSAGAGSFAQQPRPLAHEHLEARRRVQSPGHEISIEISITV